MALIKSLRNKLRSKRPNASSPYIPGNPSIVKGSESFRAYPAKTYLGEQGENAYHLIAALTHENFQKFKPLVCSHFHSRELASDFIMQNEHQESLAVSYREEFGGTLVEATTNSIPLLRSIDELFNSPPAPWFAFPRLDPIEAMLPNQGSLEYWRDHIWIPYWSSLTPSEKEQFLRDAPQAWREVLA